MAKYGIVLHGGVNFEPYRVHFQNSFLRPICVIWKRTTLRRFLCVPDGPLDPGMFLLPNVGVFYEFIPLEHLEDAENGTYTELLTLDRVVKDTPYALVISTNSGLWRYSIGDTVRFTQLYPHKLVITGRTKLFINTFGEELMIENAEKALAQTCRQTGATVSEYTVAPVFMDENNNGAHQWLIEFETLPGSTEDFMRTLMNSLCKAILDYHAKRLGTGAMALRN